MATEVLHPDSTLQQGPFFFNWHTAVDEPLASPDGGAITQAAGSSSGQCGFPTPTDAAADVTGFQVRVRARLTSSGAASFGGTLTNGFDILGSWGVGTLTNTTFQTIVATVSGNGPYSAVDDLRLSIGGTALNTAAYAVDVIELLVLSGEPDNYLFLPATLMQHTVPQRKRLQLFPW